MAYTNSQMCTQKLTNVKSLLKKLWPNIPSSFIRHKIYLALSYTKGVLIRYENRIELTMELPPPPTPQWDLGSGI